LYGRVSLLIIIVWALYPFVWLLSVGMHLLGVSLEVICYCILDLLSKALYSYMLVNIAAYDSVSPDTQIAKEYV
jgi:bacteriorhodopsin